jgi:hypothetical protein
MLLISSKIFLIEALGSHTKFDTRQRRAAISLDSMATSVRSRLIPQLSDLAITRTFSRELFMCFSLICRPMAIPFFAGPQVDPKGPEDLPSRIAPARGSAYRHAQDRRSKTNKPGCIHWLSPIQLRGRDNSCQCRVGIEHFKSLPSRGKSCRRSNCRPSPRHITTMQINTHTRSGMERNTFSKRRVAQKMFHRITRPAKSRAPGESVGVSTKIEVAGIANTPPIIIPINVPRIESRVSASTAGLRCAVRARSGRDNQNHSFRPSNGWRPADFHFGCEGRSVCPSASGPGRRRDNSRRCFTPDQSIDPGCVAHDKFRFVSPLFMALTSSESRETIQWGARDSGAPRAASLLKAPIELQCVGAGAKGRG